MGRISSDAATRNGKTCGACIRTDIGGASVLANRSPFTKMRLVSSLAPPSEDRNGAYAELFANWDQFEALMANTFLSGRCRLWTRFGMSKNYPLENVLQR